jgi:hypothetical protein
VQQRAEFRGRVLLHVGQHVSVDVQCHLNLAVAEALGDDMNRLASLQ